MADKDKKKTNHDDHSKEQMISEDYYLELENLFLEVVDIIRR